MNLMHKIVTLRKAGNSRVLTVPSDLAAGVGTKYHAEVRADGSIIFQPIGHQNIFDDPDWQDYDYQKDLLDDPQLQSLNPVGKEGLE